MAVKQTAGRDALGEFGRVDKVVDKSEVFRYSIFSTCAI